MWLRTNERNEAIRSLYKTHQFILETHQDIYNWKWVIISLHNSAQAFMVLALKGTAALNVINNPKKTLDAIYGKREYPKESLKVFLNLYADIKSYECMNLNINSKFFAGTNETDEAMERLNQFRNKFIHFIPCSWSIEIDGFPKLCNDVISILEFLIFESGNVRFYEDDEIQKTKLSVLISEIRRELEILQNEYIKGCSLSAYRPM
ncbi:MAG: hypothetical protein EHM14_12990 [Methanothrix sp.]|nr:MAG: hypothetical protein EHM14_12990 [Methanothrix sp.]